MSDSFETIFIFGLLELISAPFDFGPLALVEFLGMDEAYYNLAVIGRARSQLYCAVKEDEAGMDSKLGTQTYYTLNVIEKW